MMLRDSDALSPQRIAAILRSAEQEAQNKVYLEIPLSLGLHAGVWNRCSAKAPTLSVGQLRDCHEDVSTTERVHMQVMPNNILRFHLDQRNPMAHLFGDTKMGSYGLVGALIGAAIGGPRGALAGTALGLAIGGTATGKDWAVYRLTHSPWLPNLSVVRVR